MELNPLQAISPVDGRYWNQCNELSDYFSESSLIRYRLRVEIEYLISLFPAIKIEDNKVSSLRSLYQNYSETYSVEIKELEKTTNHDVKALEYFLKKKL